VIANGFSFSPKKLAYISTYAWQPVCAGDS
jgi:hypothetical protein